MRVVQGGQVGSLTVTAQHAKEVVLYMLHAAFAHATGRYVLTVEQVLSVIATIFRSWFLHLDEQGRSARVRSGTNEEEMRVRGNV